MEQGAVVCPTSGLSHKSKRLLWTGGWKNMPPARAIRFDLDSPGRNIVTRGRVSMNVDHPIQRQQLGEIS